MGKLIEGGSLRVGRIGGVTVRLHWTAPLGAYFFIGFRFEPVAWCCFFGLILAHELGHAFVVKRVGAEVLSVNVTGFGGTCQWRGETSRVGRAAIAWGGVWAQLLLLLAALAHQRFGAPVTTPEGGLAVEILTQTNAWLAVVNLIPVRPLDGAEAWRLPLLLGAALRRRLRTRATEVDDDEFDAARPPPEVRSLVDQLLADARREEEP
jgi:Zn-dependent protease